MNGWTYIRWCCLSDKHVVAKQVILPGYADKPPADKTMGPGVLELIRFLPFGQLHWRQLSLTPCEPTQVI